MLKFCVVCLYFAVATVNFWNVNCMTKEEKELMKIMKPLAEECASYCDLNDDDLKKYKGGDDMPLCFKQCILKKLGLMNEDGKYDREGLHEAIAEYGGEKDKAKNVEEQIDNCFKANGDNNGDDEESQMKRADVIFKCLKEIE